MNNFLNTRLDGVFESSTLALNAQAKKLRAEGKPVINLTAGEPDFPTPKHIVEAAKQALERGETRYTPTAGLPKLREAISKRCTDDYGTSITPEQVVVSNGAKQALFNAIQGLLNPDDEVIVPSPFWLTYPPMIQLAGGRSMVMPTEVDNDFIIAPERLAKAFTPRTKAIIVNSPNNPTGAVQSREVLTELARLTSKYGIYLIFDDIYDKFTFAGSSWISPFSLEGVDASKIIAINGVSKTYAMTGFRIGWSVSPKDFAARVSAFQSHSTSAPSTPSQFAALAAITGPQSSVGEMRTAYAKRCELVNAELAKIPRIKNAKIGGAFYAFPDFRAYLGKRWADANELANHLLNESFLATVPGNDFGAPTHLRISFAASESDLKEGLKRLAQTLT